MPDVFAGLSPPYRTIVIDPPWDYPEGWPGASTSPRSKLNKGTVPSAELMRRRPLPYRSMTLDAIKALPVSALADRDAVLFLWTTNRYLRDAFDVSASWGFRSSQILVWCKIPRGIGPGGAFASNTEFVLYGRRGRPSTRRTDSSWWQWPRAINGMHSSKPPGFMDVVEKVSPGPYVELFARTARSGWDCWGDQAPLPVAEAA